MMHRMKILHIAIIAILSLYGYNGVALTTSPTYSDSTHSVRMVSCADSASFKIKENNVQLKKNTDWEKNATRAIDGVIVFVLLLLLLQVYVFVKFRKIEKNILGKYEEIDKKLESKNNEYEELKKIVNKLYSEKNKAQQENAREKQQEKAFNEAFINDENANKQLSKPHIKDFTDYLSAGRSDADFLLICKDTSAPFCVEYHKENRSDTGILKLLTNVINLRTMDREFRNKIIDMDQSNNVTIKDAKGYTVVSNGSVHFTGGVWKIENKIKIKLIK